MKAEPKRFAFLLLPGFSAFDLMSAIEVLKDANREANARLYDWLLLSGDGAAVRASNGIEIDVEDGLVDLTRHDRLMVLAGDSFATSATNPIVRWLRRLARFGVVMGGISSGVYALLKAGVMPKEELSTHWSYRTAMQESFPGLDVQRAIFRNERDRFSCAGGVATLDLMLHFVATDHDEDLATNVADSLVLSQPRTASHEQRISQSGRIGARNSKIVQAIEIMEATLETPISPSQIADEIGISTRQLERLFVKYLTRSPKAYYMGLRLEQARSLLLQTDLKVIDVAMACGFNSASHFSKVYVRQFGITPYNERGFKAKPAPGETS